MKPRIDASFFADTHGRLAYIGWRLVYVDRSLTRRAAYFGSWEYALAALREAYYRGIIWTDDGKTSS